MEIQRTVNANGIKDAGGKDWYLSVKPASPKQTLSVRFEDGKQYKYLGTGKVNVGDPVVIDFGGATSYMMGNVSAAEDGITIKRSHALKPLFTFSAGPDKTEIKKNAEGIRGLEEVKDVAGFFADTPGQMNEDRFRVVDYLVGGVLNAITVITVLANGVFKDCKGLKTMDLRTTQVTEICTHAFNGSGLASILLPSTLEIINGSVFAKTKLAEITIPASVREINFFAFLDDATKYAPMKRIVFEGTEPINFKMESVAPDCEVVCNRDCGLFTMLDKQNSELGIKAADHPTWKTAVPCKLTGV